MNRFLGISGGLLAAFSGAVSSVSAQIASERVALNNTMTPDGAFFNDLFTPVIDDSGSIAFLAATNNGSAIYYGTAAQLSAFIQGGAAAPGLPGRTIPQFGGLDGRIVLSPGGKIAFSGRVQGSDITESNNDTSWVGTRGGPLYPYYREGTMYPGWPAPLMFSVGVQVANDQGASVLPVIDSGTQYVSIWYDQTGAGRIVNQRGLLAPGASNRKPIPPEKPFPPPTFATVGPCSLNPSGASAFFATTSANLYGSTGIWFNNGSAIIPVALRDENYVADDFAALPSGYGTGAITCAIAVNGSGRVLFSASRWVGDPSVDVYRGLFLWSEADGLQMARRDGQPAPGGGTYNFAVTENAAVCRINSRGDVAFVAHAGPFPPLEDPPLPQPPLALYAGSPLGTLERVILQNEQAADYPAGSIYQNTPFQLFMNSQGTIVFPTSVRTNLGQLRTVLYRARPSSTGYTVEKIIGQGDVIQVSPGDSRTVDSIMIPMASSGGQDGQPTLINSSGVITFGVTFTNFFGSAVYRTVPEAVCAADFNGDTFVNSQDFFDFLAAFFGQQPSADFNHDMFINSQDFFDFLAAFFAGC